MKRIIFILSLAVAFLISNNLIAQTEYKLNSINNGKTINVSCTGNNFASDDAGGIATAAVNNHGVGYNYYYIICSERPTPPKVENSQVSLTFEEFNLAPGAFMQIFDGRAIDDPTKQLRTFYFTDFPTNSIKGMTFTSSFSDTTGCLSVRVNTLNAPTNSGPDAVPGFKAKIQCVERCKYPIADIDTFFIKYDLQGNMETRPVRLGADTLWNDKGLGYELIRFKSIDICPGDSLVLFAKPLFPDNDTIGGVPVQRINTCIFTWDFGDGSQEPIIPYDNKVTHRWYTPDGYDLQLFIKDTNNGGCTSRNPIDTRVRISRNPIKTISPLPNMCSGEVYSLNVGYGGGSSIVVDSVNSEKQIKELFDSIVFIPDGPTCVEGEPYVCFESPIFFDQFRPGTTLVNVSDIISVCIEIEHSYVGDLGIELICPSGSTVTLKAFNSNAPISYLGIPYGGNNHGDPLYDNSIDCTSPPNQQGLGFAYCFSNVLTKNQRGLLNNCPNITVDAPMFLAALCVTCDSTNRADSTGYYVPDAGGVPGNFSSLVGCQLNGEWKIKICDYAIVDNGFLFAWNMELALNSESSWTYQVPLDTVIWKGPFMNPQTNLTSLLAPPIESCGKYIYNISIIDDYNCNWDTVTSLDVVCTPIVNLGPDTAICERMSVELDAGDPSPVGVTTYKWEPEGQDTQKIVAQTLPNSNSIIKYTASVTNYDGKTYCYGADSINLIVYPATMASFTMDKSPLEGCEPLEFQLLSTSSNAVKYEWIVGQTKSFDENPTYSLPYGTYDIKLKVTSVNGCTDSVSQAGIINVYKSPVANFGWNPLNPYVTNPTAFFVNLTTPKDISNQYHWKMQTDKDYTDLRENVFGLEPAYTWYPQPGDNVAGDYYVTLDAYSVNKAPSGFTYECHDTISKMITIINDNLLFPTAVTPNGDGINDVFVIKNLIEGQAFPDNELSIFNRLGKRIYFKQDIRNADEFWDPAVTNSPTGTYYYKFVGHGSIRNLEKNGAVELLR